MRLNYGADKIRQTARNKYPGSAETVIAAHEVSARLGSQHRQEELEKVNEPFVTKLLSVGITEDVIAAWKKQTIVFNPGIEVKLKYEEKGYEVVSLDMSRNNLNLKGKKGGYGFAAVEEISRIK